MARMIQLSDGRVLPETEMTPEQVAYYDRQNAPKTPLEAAIDRATGFKPEDMSNVARETKQGDPETKQGDPETKQGDLETKQGDPETKRGDSGTLKRDWVEEAYKCFIKDAGDIDPTDPISAIAHYFAKNATPELKARCEKEGKNATGCWRFIEAVARKALHGSSGHIDPAVVYAIAMHWFEDVPKDWDKPAPSPKAKTAKPAKSAKPKKPAERPRTPSVIKKEAAKAKAAKAKRKPKQSQGFFFEMLETPVTTPEKESEVK